MLGEIPGMNESSTEVEKGEKAEGDNVVFRGDDTSEEVEHDEGHLHRHLKSRHLQMIALGGTIGTGLFVGTGAALSSGGPLGIFLAYSIMGTIVFSMMSVLGEMTTLYPVAGAFQHYASRFVDPALGFALGWNYWYQYTITLPAEISAAALVVQFWTNVEDINVGVWISVFIVTICSFNFLGVRAYGEAEFWMSVMKITAIVGLIILGIVITCGGVPGTEPIGFRYWRNPGPFPQLNGIPGAKGQFLSFWYTFIQAAYSFIGTEIVALTAGEAANPRRNVPKAIRRVFWRILIFYVLGVFILGLTVSPLEPNLLHGQTIGAQSPWVIAISNAGIKGLPSVINAVILVSAFSAGNSDLYAASRTLYGLACDGKAPAFLRRCTKSGIPIYALGITSSFSLLAFLSCNKGAAVIFNDLVTLSSITGLLTWGCIFFSYLRFYHGLKAQGIDRQEFLFIAPLQPWASYYGLSFVTVILFFNGFSVFLKDSFTATKFVLAYITIISFIVFYAFWKLFHKSRFVSLEEIDFETGRRELDEMSDAEQLKYEEPTTIFGKIFNFIF